MAATLPSWALDIKGVGEVQERASGPGGQWAALNVEPNLIRSLLVRKFKVPTPIQRASIPPALSKPPRDILAMARTGSGKTLAYLIPLLQKTGATHHTQGPRALILCPSRELAVQIYSVGKDLARGVIKGKGKGKKQDMDGEGELSTKEGLKWAVIIGGEGMDAQFAKMSAIPDIIIATPGRFLHLIVEMRFDLRHLQTVIYDEADRLFEMGFDVQLREILHRLPSTRQNMLFSATLPSSVAEFAKAGLVNPLLVRLDADQKISSDLTLRFLNVKPTEKEAALLLLLREILGKPNQPKLADSSDSSQAIVFVATKHHVDYIAELLRVTGYRTSHIYSSLDQVARAQQLSHFRNRSTNVLVVTDVAARGLDIPVMDHVVNYDFPAGPRIFVHRVGRTARAGRRGTAYSLIVKGDFPYLCDLHTFLGTERMGESTDVLRSLPIELISEQTEYVFSSLEEIAPHLTALRNVMRKGQGMFERSRSKANPTSYRQAKALASALSNKPPRVDDMFEDVMDDEVNEEKARLLAKVAAFVPAETVFEVGKRESEGAVIMKRRRKTADDKFKRSARREIEPNATNDSYQEVEGQRSISQPSIKSFKDHSFYLEHSQKGAEVEKGYSLKSGLSDALSTAVTNMTADEGAGPRVQKASQLNWDRKKRKFVKSSGNPDGEKMIKSESGALLPASYNSGKYQEWRQKRKHLPDEPVNALGGGRRGKHGPPGHQRSKANEEDSEKSVASCAKDNSNRKEALKQKSTEKFRKRDTKQSSGLKSADDIRKQRLLAQKRKEKNARRPHKGRK
nr:ATP-dependent RNA helicase DBP10 [Cryptococcus depauperatus CBS 7855]